MKASELRIGNYIKAAHEVEIDKGNGIIEDAEIELILRIRGIDEDSQLIDGSCTFSLEEIGTDYQLDKYKNLEKIHINEQWLLDFGFDFINNQGCWHLNGFKLFKIINNDGYRLNMQMASIIYVHQLQNHTLH